MVKTKVYLICASISSTWLIFMLVVYHLMDSGTSKSKHEHGSYISSHKHKFIKQKKFDIEHIKEVEYLNKKQVSMDDPRLIKLIREYWIENPSDLDYDLEFPDLLDPSAGQAAFIDNRMNFKEKGFYVECGALDGETRSNTLMLERLRKWNGLLIEADPLNYEKLKKKHRKAFMINACLSIYPFPVKMQFKQRFSQGKLVETSDDLKGKKGTIVEVQCFPMYSILLALNITDINFLSLDVEGDELRVLQTIPFDKVDIEMMTVEYKHVDLGENYLKNYVESKGYDSLLKVSHYRNWANDIIFKKKQNES